MNSKTFATSDLGLAAWLNMPVDNTIDGPPRLTMLKSEKAGGSKFEFIFLDPEGVGADLAIAYTRTESALHDQHVRNLKGMVLNRSSADGVDQRTAGPGSSRGRSSPVSAPAQGIHVRSGS